MAKDPAMLWYWNDWHGGTITFSRHLKGCYIDLLHAQFNNGRLSLEEVKTVLGNDFALWGTLSKKFTVDETGKYFNERLEQEKIKRQEFSKKQSTNGLLGGRPPKRNINNDWEEMLVFFDNACLNCGYKFPEGERPTKDHIVPQIAGGSDDITNLQPLCRQCNSSKCAAHQTDYRLKFFAKIPNNLKLKWFIKSQEKPRLNPNKTLLENENRNENENKDMGVQGEKELTPLEIGNTVEFIDRICQAKLSHDKVKNYWQAFIINGREKAYLSRDKETQHFRNWVKKEIQNGNKSTSNSNGAHKPGTSEARIEALRNWGK